jgi:hypothetical protein
VNGGALAGTPTKVDVHPGVLHRVSAASSYATFPGRLLRDNFLNFPHRSALRLVLVKISKAFVCYFCRSIFLTNGSLQILKGVGVGATAAANKDARFVVTRNESNCYGVQFV